MFYLLSVAFSQPVLPTTLHKSSQEGSATNDYISRVIFKIKKNLRLDEIKTTGFDMLIAEVVMKILSSGIVIDLYFQKESTNEYLNIVILDAIIASLPFEPFPPEIREVAFIKVNLKFIVESMPNRTHWAVRFSSHEHKVTGLINNQRFVSGHRLFGQYHILEKTYTCPNRRVYIG